MERVAYGIRKGVDEDGHNRHLQRDVKSQGEGTVTFQRQMEGMPLPPGEIQFELLN